ncbi:MAG TPA: class I SAM-dependent methyltransferase [Pyrinomonadaceae bacterium]|nr:class I SAM-dependent methyltransferase [Pyrinomonadaceae bacterium]
MRKFLKGFARQAPAPVAEKALAPESAPAATPFPPGHFYSPIPSIEEVERDAERIFKIPGSLPGIDLNEAGQLELLAALEQFYPEMPFPVEKATGLRYYFENPNYGYSDAICLYAMIRHLRPRKIIEVGSGFSSCAMLDTNELFCANEIKCLFIDPNPHLLLSLIKETDRERIGIIPARLQDVGLGVFSSLSANDILFIDSTHVSKVGSDVNHIVFEILPRLPPGVFIHFHDIFYPFEYGQSWICKLGLAWNECYILRAFLQYNDAFQIALFNTYLAHFYEERFRAAMPLCLRNRGGSLWLRKL